MEGRGGVQPEQQVRGWQAEVLDEVECTQRWEAEGRAAQQVVQPTLTPCRWLGTAPLLLPLVERWRCGCGGRSRKKAGPPSGCGSA